MDAVLAGNTTGMQSALAMGDKITDADASGLDSADVRRRFV